MSQTSASSTYILFFAFLTLKEINDIFGAAIEGTSGSE